MGLPMIPSPINPIFIVYLLITYILIRYNEDDMPNADMTGIPLSLEAPVAPRDRVRGDFNSVN
jgi:hypothetical protein